jgi:hypothetical protein
VKAAGKQAPAKIKNAASKLASFYSALASGDASKLANASNLGSASATFFTYAATHCH